MDGIEGNGFLAELSEGDRAAILDSLTEENIRRMVRSLVYGEAQGQDEATSAAGPDQTGTSFGSGLAVLLGILALAATLVFFPEVVPEASQLLSAPSVQNWLEWVDHVTKRGWPPSLTVWSVWDEDLDEAMVERFSSEESWSNYFRGRAMLSHARQALIEQAIAAYHQGFYAAATTLFVSQIDGMIFDLTNAHWTYAQQAWVESHLAPLPSELGRWAVAATESWNLARQSGAPSEISGWNRHQIIHGVTTDTNTPLCALKAAALLEMAWMICLISELWIESPQHGEERRDHLLRACHAGH